MEPPTGIEPATIGSKDRRSATELRRHTIYIHRLALSPSQTARGASRVETFCSYLKNEQSVINLSFIFTSSINGFEQKVPDLNVHWSKTKQERGSTYFAS